MRWCVRAGRGSRCAECRRPVLSLTVAVDAGGREAVATMCQPDSCGSGSAAAVLPLRGGGAVDCGRFWNKVWVHDLDVRASFDRFGMSLGLVRAWSAGRGAPTSVGCCSTSNGGSKPP